MPRFRLVALLIGSLILLGAKADDFDLRVLLATLALGMLLMLAKYLVERDRALLRFESRVDGALWGPEDANGKRNVEAGMVATVNRLAADLPRAIQAAESAAISAQQAAAHATTAAAAATTAQALLVSQTAAMLKEREP